jgi:ATP-binding cassette subfamily C protein
MFRESLQIFRRNLLPSTVAVLLIVTASLGQVVSLGSLYPILQLLTAGDGGLQSAREGIFGKMLAFIGRDVTLGNLLLLFLALGIFYSILNLVTEAYHGLHLRNLEVAVRTELFEAIVSSDWGYASRLRHGEIVNIIAREAREYQLTVKYAFYTAGSFLQFLLLVSCAAYLNWKLTLFGMCLVGIGMLGLIPILRYTSRLSNESPQIAGQMSNWLIAGLRALKTAKALSLERFLIRTVQPPFRRSASNYFQLNVLVAGQYAVMELVAFLAISAMLYVGLLVLRIPHAELFVILVVLFRALPQVRFGIDNYHRAFASFPSLQLVRQHLALAQAARGEQGHLQVTAKWQTIVFQNVTFRFNDSPVVIDRFNTQIRRGEFWVIVGPSGIGKSTLLDLLLGLRRPESGEILVDNVSLRDADLISWHSQLAYLGQESFVLAGTLRSNLLWGTDVQHSDDELLAALKAVRLDTLADNVSLLLEREVTENGNNLSGGEKQRLALARLFLRQPALIMLDEPTTGLDAETERLIFSAIQRFSTNVTLVVVTHHEELARDADHIIRFSPEGIAIEAKGHLASVEVH